MVPTQLGRARFVVPCRGYFELSITERLRVLRAFQRAAARPFQYPDITKWPEQRQTIWASQVANMRDYVAGLHELAISPRTTPEV